MSAKNMNFKAIVSSDWNECMAPCGPFDFISFAYPELETDLKNVFKQYTGNIISLGEAAQKIPKLLPGPISEEQMDAYLEKCFITYKGVPDLIEWCLSKGILFMINTTGMIGYFQRVFELGVHDSGLGQPCAQALLQHLRDRPVGPAARQALGVRIARRRQQHHEHVA